MGFPGASIWVQNIGGGLAMDSFIHLDLRSDSEKPAAENLPQPEQKVNEPPVLGKRLNKMLHKAAHKGSAQYGRSSGGGIFSK